MVGHETHYSPWAVRGPAGDGDLCGVTFLDTAALLICLHYGCDGEGQLTDFFRKQRTVKEPRVFFMFFLRTTISKTKIRKFADASDILKRCMVFVVGNAWTMNNVHWEETADPSQLQGGSSTLPSSPFSSPCPQLVRFFIFRKSQCFPSPQQDMCISQDFHHSCHGMIVLPKLWSFTQQKRAKVPSNKKTSRLKLAHVGFPCWPNCDPCWPSSGPYNVHSNK